MDKYQEALERAKKGLPIDEVFPELKESEDERIRKIIIKYFKGSIGLGVAIDGVSVKDIVAHLEKQKENPKSADSIPSDCVSDAKCEDRWHKVTDSLPDNGRLVLAKDCLGNVLLARFDGENWEVNVYDNEDHYCHNSISNWCEIPSEKQKEPLTPEEKMNHPLYLEGFDVGKKVGETLKEQKPAEWNEEDVEVLETTIATIEKNIKKGSQITTRATPSGYINREDLIKKLKSLRPQPHWKPSEEQISALEYFIRSWGESGTMSPQNTILCATKSLLNDLKKL